MTVGPVLVTVVLDGQHDVLPAHVEVVPRVACGAENRDLSLRSRKAGRDEKQTQPGLLRRLCTDVDELEYLG